MWPRYHACIQSLDAGKFQGINISHENEEKAYFTKLTQKKELLSLATKPLEISKKQMETLVIRLCVDLRKETFDDQTKTIIELTQ